MKKIRITQELPINLKFRPVKGKVYDVYAEGVQYVRKAYFIIVGGIQVGVLEGECEVVNE